MKRYGNRAFVMPVLLLLLLAIGAGMLYILFGHSAPQAGAPQPAAEQYLAASSPAPPSQGFRFQDIPPWLFLHVAIIAACQVCALIGAYYLSARDQANKTQAATVQFLCEIPMYLGLFGTLLGVSLTQFITGSLVAPLAYLTTMSGIVLHVFGKLAIWLPAFGGAEEE